MVDSNTLKQLEEVLTAYQENQETLTPVVTFAQQTFGDNWMSELPETLESSSLDTAKKKLLQDKADHAIHYYGALAAWEESTAYLEHSVPFDNALLEERLPILEYWLALFGAEGAALVGQIKNLISDADAPVPVPVQAAEPVAEPVAEPEPVAAEPVERIEPVKRVEEVFPEEMVASQMPLEQVEDKPEPEVVLPEPIAATETLSAEDILEEPVTASAEEPASVAEDIPVVAEPVPVVEEPAPVVEEPVVEIVPAEEENPEPVVEENPAAEDVLVAEEPLPVAEETSEQVVEETSESVADEVVAEESTPVLEEAPEPEETAPVADEVVAEEMPVAEETVVDVAPVAKEPIPVAEEMPVAEETVVDVAPVAKEPIPVVEETPVVEEKSKATAEETLESLADLVPTPAAAPKIDKRSAVLDYEVAPMSQNWDVATFLRQKRLYDDANNWLNAWCIRMDSPEKTAYPHYGFIADLMYDLKEKIQNVLENQLLEEIVEQDVEGGRDAMIRLNASLDEEIEGLPDDFKHSTAEKMKLSAREILGEMDNSTDKEYIGKAPDGFELMDDPYAVSADKIISDFEKTEQDAQNQIDKLNVIDENSSENTQKKG